MYNLWQVRCALDCGEIKMMIDVAGATERWRKGEVEVRRRVRGTDASSLLPRFTEAAAVRAALLANETWSSELETVEKRCDEARVLLEVGFAKAPVAAPKDRATELSAGIRDTLVLKTAGDSATTRWRVPAHRRRDFRRRRRHQRDPYPDMQDRDAPQVLVCDRRDH